MRQSEYPPRASRRGPPCEGCGESKKICSGLGRLQGDGLALASADHAGIGARTQTQGGGRVQARLSPVGTTVVSLRRLRETPQVPLTLEPSEGLEGN